MFWKNLQQTKYKTSGSRTPTIGPAQITMTGWGLGEMRVCEMCNGCRSIKRIVPPVINAAEI